MSPPFNGIDILLVEDNPHDAELTMLALQEHNLVNRIFTVTDGPAALDFVFAQGAYTQRRSSDLPKVVLLDLKLPKLNGFEVLRAIRSRPETALLPVVIITSSDADPDIKTAYQLGANSYVVKPVEFQSFQRAMSGLGFYWLMVNKPALPS
jgi:two-component system response regulator